MTKIRRIALTLAASTAIGSLAVLSPLAAQAKSVDWLKNQTGGIPMAACFGAPGEAKGYVTGEGTTSGTFKIKVPTAGDYEFRARYGYWDAKQKKMLFAKVKVDPTGTPLAASGSVINKQQLVIYRLDVIDIAAEQLVYTSDGVVGCD